MIALNYKSRKTVSFGAGIFQKIQNTLKNIFGNQPCVLYMYFFIYIILTDITFPRRTIPFRTNKTYNCVNNCMKDYT